MRGATGRGGGGGGMGRARAEARGATGSGGGRCTSAAAGAAALSVAAPMRCAMPRMHACAPRHGQLAAIRVAERVRQAQHQLGAGRRDVVVMPVAAARDGAAEGMGGMKQRPVGSQRRSARAAGRRRRPSAACGLGGCRAVPISCICTPRLWGRRLCRAASSGAAIETHVKTMNCGGFATPPGALVDTGTLRAAQACAAARSSSSAAIAMASEPPAAPRRLVMMGCG